MIYSTVQKALRPEVDDVLPYYLEGKMLESALDFIAFLRAEKMKPGWVGVHNAWRSNGKGKPLCYVRLGREWVRDTKNVKWVVVLYLDCIDDYINKINIENLQDIVWNDLHYCGDRDCANGCSPGETKTILGKEFSGLCPIFYNRVNFVNPDESAIRNMVSLLRLERDARKRKKA